MNHIALTLSCLLIIGVASAEAPDLPPTASPHPAEVGESNPRDHQHDAAERVEYPYRWAIVRIRPAPARTDESVETRMTPLLKPIFF